MLVLYHLEALMNQAMYPDFENCTFQKNGSPKCLDPKQDRQENFASFVALRNLSWNEVLKKGTKYHREDFSRFCDQKMSCIVSTLKPELVVAMDRAAAAVLPRGVWEHQWRIPF